MTLNDFTWKLKEFWNDFKKEKTGLIGLGILLFSLLVVIFEPFFLPYREANTKWRSIDYWQDNPAGAAPAWTNWFSSKKSAKTMEITDFSEKDEINPHYGAVKTYNFEYNYTADLAPADIIFRVQGNKKVFFNIEVIRPDGEELHLGQFQKQNAVHESIRFSTQADGRSATRQFAQSHGASSASGNARPTEILFSKAERDMLRKKEALKGVYTFKVSIPESIAANADNGFTNPKIIVAGKVSGVLGTDIQKRDVFSGIIAGLKWALFIGIITSMISVLIGVLYGIVSAYFGGFVDTMLSFIFEIFVSIPILPVLIVVSAAFKPSIWVIVLALIIFSWVGPVKTVRSMALQIKEETYIEAAKALGSGKWRIIFKHMMPLLLPYSFASMALNVPGTIVFEASLSLLGLGDPTIVTWGQILHDAQVSGATLNGLWWWIIPPGLFIALMGMTFAFLGFAMDKILHPKLRTR
ncbi:MAG: ABC transporter permease [Treponema phagedenis]|uniref:ABC transporter permease n=1 Tax=Treponema phagedenis TaxID=162 RepID=UPI0001F640CA|nr:ABC transporter permease [Treponema phagedenis]EFW37222.1 ABC transporter, permease protein [Treponema phagedenis F0421]QEK03091.1 ABC transporter permease [Treponema phagedenis]QEK08717.1 ABC transporter permease [Treponema phagedenis]QSH95880.1 ABC transporter permease [Treponema phagedenis]TYT79324.1 ABC transporter permease [Treponema phagedenis]